MAHIRVKSSQIHSWGFDPVDEKLTVNFLCFGCRGEKTEGCAKCRATPGISSTYEYSDVPAAAWDKLRTAESAGASLNSLIKRGEHFTPPKPFAYKRVSP